MKHLGLALLKGVAKGVVHYGSAGLIPGVAMDWLIDGGEAICNDVWEYWGKDRKEQERRQAIEEVAQATAAELRDEIEVIAREELADRPDERATLAALLHQLQPCVRRTLRRPEDPQGLTTAAWRQFDSPSALLPLIPTRIPKFQAGMQPIAGIDLELAEFLGIGGFGEVWKAVNPLFSAKEPVALKFCLDPQAARSLKNEVKLLNLVIEKGKHPGIVELRNTYFRSDVPALEYEYVAGGDLGDLIQQWHANGQLPAVPLIRESIRELATTLDFAHQHGIVHRDLKPANILVPMLNRSGLRFKIADFGIGSLQATVENRVPNRGMSISRRMSETITGSHTPLYSSPEQTAGRLASDPSDDIYSLGVIWSQMLFGDLGCGVRGGRKWQEELRARGITNEEIELLIDCSEEREHRPKNAAEFLRRLDEAMPVADESEVELNHEEREEHEEEPTEASPVASALGFFGLQKSTPSADKRVGATSAEPSRAASAPIVFADRQAGDRSELVPGIPFRWCPAGHFRMGSPKSELGCDNKRNDDENPVQVTLTQGFWLGETEVTQGQWRKLMGTTPWKGESNVKEGDDYAASYIDYDAAMGFCEKLTIVEKEAGRLPHDWKYVLPTEAQWEYACRAGTKTKYSYGESELLLIDYGWFNKNTNIAGEQYAHPVGQKKPNGWELRDMHGNVCEWCSDWYGNKLAGGSDPQGASSGSSRVIRGGSWNSAAANCRSSNRSRTGPENRYNLLGFRVAGVPSSQ